MRLPHGAARPAAYVGVGAVHPVYVRVAVMQLEGQWSFPGTVGIVIVPLSDNVDNVICPVNRHGFLVPYYPRLRHLVLVAGVNNLFPCIVRKIRLIRHRRRMHLALPHK